MIERSGQLFVTSAVALAFCVGVLLFAATTSKAEENKCQGAAAALLIPHDWRMLSTCIDGVTSIVIGPLGVVTPWPGANATVVTTAAGTRSTPNPVPTNAGGDAGCMIRNDTTITVKASNLEGFQLQCQAGVISVIPAETQP